MKRERFKSEELYDYSMKIMRPEYLHLSEDIQLLNPKQRYLNDDEAAIIERKTKMKLTRVSFSHRISIKGDIYWSKNYPQRGCSDSYTICFQTKKEKSYGEILEFFQKNNEFYCFVSQFNVL